MGSCKFPPAPTRRQLLALSGSALLPACESRRGNVGAPTPVPAPASADLRPAPRLRVAQVGEMDESQRGGVAVVLLHGWGAEGDDLVPLARQLARPNSRFFLPAAPLERPSGGRAWWHLDSADRPEPVYEARWPEGYAPRAAVRAARAEVQRLLSDVRSRYRPERLVLGGFSQGAMLSLDVALAARPSVDRVAALSGLLIADSVPALLAASAPLPAVLVAHGRSDRVLPFAAGEAAAKMLKHRGFAVSFHAFDGGHQIPSDVVQALLRFIYQ